MSALRFAKDPVRFEVRLSWDDGDPWGSALSALGGICDVLYHLHKDHLIPDDAGYWPGAGGPDVTDYPAAMFLELLEQGLTTFEALAYWARVLSRFADIVPDDRRY